MSIRVKIIFVKFQQKISEIDEAETRPLTRVSSKQHTNRLPDQTSRATFRATSTKKADYSKLIVFFSLRKIDNVKAIFW